MKSETRVANKRAERNIRRKNKKREERSGKESKMKLSKEIRQIFLGEDCEPVTEELINELISQGHKKEDLQYFADNGFQYCRPRNSFIEPVGDQNFIGIEEEKESEEERIRGLLFGLPDWICAVIVSMGKDDEVLVSAMIGTSVFNMYIKALIEKYYNPGCIAYESDLIEKQYSLNRYKAWMN